MIRWTGLAPWEFEFPFPGSLTSTFLTDLQLLYDPGAGGVLLPVHLRRALLLPQHAPPHHQHQRTAPPSLPRSGQKVGVLTINTNVDPMPLLTINTNVLPFFFFITLKPRVE